MRRKPFTVVVADPPWKFNDKLPGDGRGAEKHYKVLTTRDIEEFRLPPIADDALLFLWRVSSQVEEAVRVCRAWGFVPKSEIVWVKVSKHHAAPAPVQDALAFGMGRYVRLCHEVCMVASRGRGNLLIQNRSMRSVFFAPLGRHSEKPEVFFDMVESLAPAPGTCVELFARRQRPGWLCLGDESHPDEASAAI